ncbi:MAG: preprotein translocase subunit SecE [Clostridia bacterium]|nr:preprotein translocase subunit SecE [Clostridia bacterium]MDD4798891.1 preprotein translocase subunit SecE [Clostridia bacterium]
MAQATTSDKKKVSRSGRIGNFFKGVKSEMKKVHWPSKKEVVTYTGVVIITCAIVAGAIFVVDSVLSALLQLVIK